MFFYVVLKSFYLGFPSISTSKTVCEQQQERRIQLSFKSSIFIWQLKTYFCKALNDRVNKRNFKYVMMFYGGSWHSVFENGFVFRNHNCTDHDLSGPWSKEGPTKGINTLWLYLRFKDICIYTWWHLRWHTQLPWTTLSSSLLPISSPLLFR